MDDDYFSAVPFSDADFSDSGFFNREMETKQLWSSLTGKPAWVTVLTGPPNCGKTALIHHLNSLEGPAKLPMMILDCRDTTVTTPQQMARALRQLALDAQAEWAAIAAVLGKGVTETMAGGDVKAATDFKVLADNIKEFFNKSLGEASSLADIITAYDKLLAKLPEDGPTPVIVIDEANRLLQWREEDGGETKLEELLNFFVAITKQDKRAHVVLATADFLLVDWLGRSISQERMQVKVLGDLPEEEAKRYVCGAEGEGAPWKGLVAKFPPKLAADVRKRWPEIYDVCGGNPGQLFYCLDSIRTDGVDGGLRIIKRLSTRAVWAGLEPSSLVPRASPPAWTTEQYKDVLRLIATAPHHAVRRHSLEQALGSDGAAVVKSMMEYNLLTVRSRSTLARDLPEEVYFEGALTDAVVMLPSPGRTHIVLQMLSQGLLEPDPLKKQQASS